MDGLKGFLHRFKHLEAKEPKVVQEVSRILNTIIGVTVPVEHIVFQRGIIFLRVSPSIRHVVSVKKESLLTTFKEGVYTQDILDIR